MVKPWGMCVICEENVSNTRELCVTHGFNTWVVVKTHVSCGYDMEAMNKPWVNVCVMS